MCFASLSFNSCLFRLFVKLLSETNAFLQRLGTHLILQVMTLHLHWYRNTHRLRKQGLLLLVAKLPLVSLVVVLLFNRGQKTFHGHPPTTLPTLPTCFPKRTHWQNVNRIMWLEKMFAGCCLFCSVIFVCGLYVFVIISQLAEHVDFDMWQSLGIVKHSGTWQWQAGRWKQWL